MPAGHLGSRRRLLGAATASLPPRLRCLLLLLWLLVLLPLLVLLLRWQLRRRLGVWMLRRLLRLRAGRLGLPARLALLCLLRCCWLRHSQCSALGRLAICCLPVSSGLRGGSGKLRHGP